LVISFPEHRATDPARFWHRELACRCRHHQRRRPPAAPGCGDLGSECGVAR